MDISHEKGLQALVSGLQVIDPSISLVLFANSPTCYNVEAKSGVGKQWTRDYGGPGGCTVQ